MKSTNIPISWTRRDFLGTLAAASAAVSFPQTGFATSRMIAKENYSIHVFSKHLQFLDYEAMAETAAEVGFDGVDMTVRPGGHVLPENVEEDLPKAVEAVKKSGLMALLMTTAVMDASDRIQQKVLKTARELGIQYYRTNYLNYEKNTNIPQALEQFKQQLKALAGMNQQLDIRGAYQNHSGSHYLGAPVWDLATLLQDVDSEYLGSQYDIRHATVEGGLSWPLGLNLIHPHINTIVVKDCKWEKVNGEWQVVNTPLGEGMIDFASYFTQLKSYNIAVPVSVHFEYEMPEHDASLSESDKRKKTVAVMKKDMETLKNYMAEAGLI